MSRALHAVTSQREVPFAGRPLALFERLAAVRSDTLLFESRDGNNRNNVQSLLFLRAALRVEGRGDRVTLRALSDNGRAALAALAPALGELAEVDVHGDTLQAVFAKRSLRGSDRDRLAEISPAHTLRLLTLGWQRTGDTALPIHLPGIFAYDLVEQHEQLPAAKKDSHGFPDFIFWLPEQCVVVDHRRDVASLIEHRFGDTPPSGDRPVDETVIAALQQAPAEKDEPVTLPRPGRGDLASDVDLDDDTYAALVVQLKEHIVAGDVFQIVPSRTFRMPCPDPLAAYRELARLNPSPYQFFVCAPEFTVFGASPETAVAVRGEPRKVRLHPLAGTRPRGRTAEGEIDHDLDNRLEAELKLDAKELAEHMMLVDLARNDVARICIPGGRHVVRLLEVDRFSHVMHLVSVVEGELREEVDALAAYLSAMNMGTLVGAPKIEAARLLRKFELDRRGPYGGGVGYLTSAGELDAAIVIRAALVRDGVAYVRAGAGVVHDSDPASEATETRNKAAAVLQAIAMAEEKGR